MCDNKEEVLLVEVMSTPANAMTLIDGAIKQGLTADTIEKLYNLHERISDRHEAHRFHEAIDAFQSQCPPIKRNKNAKISTDRGSQFSYSYADLEEIERTIRPILHENGLSYSWDSEVNDQQVMVTCVLRHVEGHKISARFSSPVDSRGNKSISDAQKHGVALTYGRRQSLIQALGLRVGEPDTDGKEFEGIAEERLADLQALMEESGITKKPAHLQRFLNYFKVKDISEIPDIGYDRAVNLLNEYRRENHD